MKPDREHYMQGFIPDIPKPPILDRAQYELQVDALDLSNRARRVLLRAHEFLGNLDALRTMPDSALHNIYRGMGEKTLREIREKVPFVNPFKENSTV
jgi:hypothetical protein